MDIDSAINRPPNVGAADTEIQFPLGRNPKLPRIYIMKKHPLHRGSSIAYYYIHEGSREASEKAYRMEVEDLKIPQGPIEEAIALGFLELVPGDAIFSRMSSAPASGLEDMVVCWVTGSGIYSDHLRTEALGSRDAALGPRSQRTRGHAVRDPDTGRMEGGTTWERSLEGKFNPKRGRCYPYGCTYQKQRSLYSPCAAGKLSVADDDTLKMRSDLTDVVTEMAVLSLSQGPRHVVDAIRLNHEIFNTPRVGSHLNFAFSSNQLNLAHAREWDSCETLADSMGIKFGAAHIDNLDSPGHFTNMLALSDLPDNCDPGRFFIVYPGVFCTLRNFVSVNFSGLRVHGGSPPIAAKGTSDYDMQWSTRFINVSYAKTGPTSDERKMPLLQIESDKILSVTPEMLRPGRFELDKTFDASNFITEGPSMMSASMIMDFLAKCFLTIILSTVSRLPHRLGVAVDSDAFLGAFTYLDENGTRRRINPWVNGPGWRPSASVSNGKSVGDACVVELHNQEEHVAAMRQLWKDHENRCGAHIPSAVCCVAGIKPLEGWADGDTITKMKPLLFNKGKNKQSSDGESSGDETPVPDIPPKKKKRKNKNSKGRGNIREDVERSLLPDARESGPATTLGVRSSLRNLRSNASFIDESVSGSTATAAYEQHPASRKKLVPYVLINSINTGWPITEQDSDSSSDEALDTRGRESDLSDGEYLPSEESAGKQVHGSPEHGRQPCVPYSPTLTSLNARLTVSPEPSVASQEKSHSGIFDVPNDTLSSLFGLQNTAFDSALDYEYPAIERVHGNRNVGHGMPRSIGLAESVLGASVNDDPSVPIVNGTRPHTVAHDATGHSLTPLDESRSSTELEAVVIEDPRIRSARKRTLSEASDDQNNGDASGESNSEDGDDAADASRSYKRKYTGFDQIWNSDGYKKLEIHITDCTPVSSRHYKPRLGAYLNSTSNRPLAVNDASIHASAGSVFDEDSLASDHEDREEVNNQRALPKFLRGITSGIVHSELRRLHDDIVSLAAFRSSFNIARTVNSLVDFQDRVSVRPLDVSSLTSVQVAWNGISVLSQHEKFNSIRMRKHRACIMLASSAAWKWLTVVIPDAISGLVHGGSVHCRWLSDLLTAIRAAVLTRDKDARFYPYHFGLHLSPVRAAAINFSDYLIPGDIDFDGWTELHCSVATEIIEVWLDFPSDGNEMWQGLYALHIAQTIGPEFLLLNVVWDRYKSADYSLVESPYLPEEMNRAHYPLLCSTSSLRTNIVKIANLVNDYVEGRLYRYVDLTTPRGMSMDYASEGLLTVYEEHAIEFKQYILDCFKVVFRGDHIENRKLARKLMSDSDKFSPFRECASTRSNMVKNNRPFSPVALQTTPGLFSAVVCRAVTFGTTFARTARTLFTSPKDFWQAVADCPGAIKESDYCDRSAYGGFNPGRKSNMVEVYWDSVNDERWNGLDTAYPLSFEDAYTFFCPPANRPRRFLQLGALGSYLLTVDYVYAGLVLAPTLEYLALMVCDLNKGPARALEHMGLVPKTVKEIDTPAFQAKRRQQFIPAFKLADQLVRDAIPQEYHREAGLDMFVTEHSLCKYGRARDKCGYSLSS